MRGRVPISRAAVGGLTREEAKGGARGVLIVEIRVEG